MEVVGSKGKDAEKGWTGAAFQTKTSSFYTDSGVKM